MKRTTSVVGFHGTTKINAQEIHHTEFRTSRRPGLWLGFGRYFFQDAPIHALHWGQYRARKETGDAGNAAVLRVEIDLSECLDLTDRLYWREILAIWESDVSHTGIKQFGMDELLRRLTLSDEERAVLTEEEKKQMGINYVDCEVMNIFIQRMKDKLRPKGFDYTTVRAAVVEGAPVYKNSWLWNQSSVIISVLEPRAFLGPL